MRGDWERERERGGWGGVDNQALSLQPLIPCGSIGDFVQNTMVIIRIGKKIRYIRGQRRDRDRDMMHCIVSRLISIGPRAVKHEGFRHCSGVVVAREVG